MSNQRIKTETSLSVQKLLLTDKTRLAVFHSVGSAFPSTISHSASTFKPSYLTSMVGNSIPTLHNPVLISKSKHPKGWRSMAPSFVTSTTLFPFSVMDSSPSSRRVDLMRFTVGNLSISAHCRAYSALVSCPSPSRSGSYLEEPLLKLEVCLWNDDLMLLPISASSTLNDSISSAPAILAMAVA